MLTVAATQGHFVYRGAYCHMQRQKPQQAKSESLYTDSPIVAIKMQGNYFKKHLLRLSNAAAATLRLLRYTSAHSFLPSLLLSLSPFSVLAAAAAFTLPIPLAF